MAIAKRNLNLDQNPNLKPTKKKWVGSLDFPQTDNISNNIDQILMSDYFVWKGIELTQDYLRTIDEDGRDEIAKDVYNFLLKYDFNKFKFEKEDLDRSWKALCKFECKTTIRDEITYVSNAGTSGNAIYRSYFPNINKIRGNKRPSIYDVLTDKDKLWAVIFNRIGNSLLYNDNRSGIPVQYPMPMKIGQMLIGAKNSGLASMGSIFKPSVAKCVYDKYVKPGNKVLDYSCGFGTRLLGLMSLNRGALYYGYEPNSETYNHLNKMIKDYNFKAEIKMCGSEEEKFDQKFDFIFSSPPYFTQEKYCDEETQCYNKYPEYEGWLEGYWRQTVKNIKEMSHSETIFGINVGGQSNELMQRIEKDINRIIGEEGYNLIDTWYMETSKSHLSAKKDTDKKMKLEGMFFYGL